MLVILPFMLNSCFQEGNPDEQKPATQLISRDSIRVHEMIYSSRKIHQKNHQEDEEYRIAQEAVDLALLSNDTLLYALSLDNLGLLYRYHEWYGQSLPFHIKAYDLIANKPVKPINKMIFANNAGLSARYDQQYDLSVEYYLKALKLAEDEENLMNISISSNGIGNALSEIPGREEEALQYFIRALNTQKEMGSSLGVAMNLLSISDYYLKNKNFPIAFRYLDTLYSVNLGRKDTFGLALSNQAYGSAYFKENRTIQKAEPYYLKSLQQFRGLNNKTKEAEVLNDLGHFYQRTERIDTALSYYLHSLNLANEIRNKALVSANAFAISSIKEARREYEQSLRYYQMGKNYEDSIAMSEQQVKVATLTSQYKLEQKESEIDKLQEQNFLDKQKIQFHRILFLIFIVCILLIVLFGVLQHKSLKVRQETLKLLHSKQEELIKAQYEKSIAQAEMIAARAQLNPHFLFNSLNGLHLFLLKKELKKADQYLIVLSRFLRMILELPRSHTISLAEELSLIKYYINLEESRFDNDFRFDLQTLPDSEIEDIKIPPLLLQPFVENAIYHGLLPSQKKSKILRIHIIKEAEATIRIIIDDNGVGRRDKPVYVSLGDSGKKKSMGTRIIRERIEQFNKSYPCKINFEIVDKMSESGERLGTTVILLIEDYIEKNTQTAAKILVE